jgi:hypothetical protein
MAPGLGHFPSPEMETRSEMVLDWLVGQISVQSEWLFRGHRAGKPWGRSLRRPLRFSFTMFVFHESLILLGCKE